MVASVPCQNTHLLFGFDEITERTVQLILKHSESDS